MYLRLATDQPLAPFNVLAQALGALSMGHGDNLDLGALTFAAERILTLPVYANFSPALKMSMAQMTNASWWEAGTHLYRGPGGVARSEQIDPARTAPVAERISQIVPGISAEILTASTRDAFGDFIGKDLVAWTLNKASGIEDTRINEQKAWYMKSGLFKALVKDIKKVGGCFA